jgi:hypothetical protein
LLSGGRLSPGGGSADHDVDVDLVRWEHLGDDGVVGDVDAELAGDRLGDRTVVSGEQGLDRSPRKAAGGTAAGTAR